MLPLPLGLAVATLLAPSSVSKAQGAWAPPYRVQSGALDPRSFSVPKLRTRLGKASSSVWQRGDTLVFLLRSKAEIVRITGSIEEPMTRVGTSDLWLLRLGMKGWENHLVRYGFFTSEEPMIKSRLWRGRVAPAPYATASRLKGRIIERTLASSSLGASRALTIYLPPNLATTSPGSLRAFYMADGQSCEAFAEVLEPLILAGKVAPAAIVGVHNAVPDNASDLRSRLRAGEYVPGQDPEAFERHLRFFVEEAVPYATREFGLSPRRIDRAVFGCSDGGTFAAYAAFRHPETFGAAVPLSSGGVLPADGRLPAAESPRFFFGAGLLEPFLRPTQASWERVRRAGGIAELRTVFGGHEAWTWFSTFARFVPLVFPPTPPVHSRS